MVGSHDAIRKARKGEPDQEKSNFTPPPGAPSAAPRRRTCGTLVPSSDPSRTPGTDPRRRKPSSRKSTLPIARCPAPASSVSGIACTISVPRVARVMRAGRGRAASPANGAPIRRPRAFIRSDPARAGGQSPGPQPPRARGGPCRCRISGASGASYGESMPVKFLSSPRRAFAYRPLGSRSSATASGVSTKTSMNSPSAQQLARHAPLGAERRDERHQHDQAGVDHQLRHLGDAADVLDPVGVGEAEVLVEAVAHVVAVEQVGVAARARAAASRPGWRSSTCRRRTAR